SQKIELSSDNQQWLKLMAEKGWTVPTWPSEYGGAGVSKAAYLVIQEEMARIGARAPLTGRGINYIGPTILEFGTEHQKRKWLPRLARGEGGWCMGYSEPEAGTDLANLQLRCEDEGDHYLLNGMKIWTSDGRHGDWIFVLARTDRNKPKHEGISLVLVNMDQPGVRVRPISLINGQSPFCETFFEDAIADKEDLIGPVNGGWAVGKRLLQHERSVHGGVNTAGAQVETETGSLADISRRYGSLNDPAFRQRLTAFEMHDRAYQLTRQRVIAETEASAPATATSILKVTGSVLTQERIEVQQAAMGNTGIGWEAPGFDDLELETTREWLHSRAVTIYGGTREIQKNIIAKRVLGLPD
ncbi:MAG: acyl-CoA dehydrogenase family protein, partial [Pseudomonadales bacterium]|nr:acyl-CoA dehydrogenase family protein [Pseudomonadales bacterium]